MAKQIIIPGQLPQHREKAPVFDSMQNSKQTFNNIGLFQAIGGDIVLRGRRGARDRVYPFQRAWQFFSQMYKFYKQSIIFGDKVTGQMRQVLEQMGAKIAEAIEQRKAMYRPLPTWINTTTLQQFNNILVSLK